MDKIYIGAAYYPEMWDEAEVDKDIIRCKELGVNVLRVAEFAWGKMEPNEGEFDFAWLKRVVDKLYENGIYTVMCTPSATPPRWLLNKYEETRMVMNTLVRADVSSRCHTCKTSEKMREKNYIIVEEMAKVFAGHDGVIGWQIDNEIFPYSEGCYCPLCQQAFRDYLKAKYVTIQNLNKIWGMTRWSLEYDSFDDVQPPYAGQWRHPSLRTEWWRFQCEQIYSYVNEQAEVLHKYGCENVGTDMMPQDLLDYYQINNELDVVQFNHYNSAKDLASTAFWYDFLRTIKDKPFWVTETQVGWNGSEFAESGYRAVGNCYINTWLPIAKGANMNLYWLFRTHPNGHEIGHGALFSAAGRQYRVSEEVKQANDDFAKCSDFLLNTKINSSIALHYSHSAEVNFASAPIIKNLNYRSEVLEKFYEAFHHYNIDVLDTPHSLDGYEIIISPFLTTADEHGFKENIIKWIENGGTWIVGPMSDIMNDSTCKYTHAPYSFLEELAGVFTKYQKPIDNDVFKAKWADGTECGISGCFDAYQLCDGTESLVKYVGDEFDGLSVVTQRAVGKGRVILLGSIISHKDIMRLIDKAPIAKASDNIILTERFGKQNGIIAVETENKEGYIMLDGHYTDIISGCTYSGKTPIKPYSVLVLKKQ